MSWLNLNDQQAVGLSANDVFYVSALLFLARREIVMRTPCADGTPASARS